MNFYGVTTHAKVTSPKSDVISVVLQFNKALQNAALVVVDAGVQFKQLPAIFLGVAHSVNTTHARNHNGVAPREKSGCCRMPQAINFIVDR